MKKAIYIILCAIALSACEKEFNIEKQMKDGMIFMKFAPSNENDTTFFFVQATTPLNDNLHPARTSGETVSLTVNGAPVGLTKDNGRSSEKGFQVYWTTHKFKGGDEIDAQAGIPGKTTVSASTVMPDEGPEFKWTTRVEGKEDSFDRQLCFDLEYVNKPGFSGHYGVAVRCERTSVTQVFSVHKENPDEYIWEEPAISVNVSDQSPCPASDISITTLGQEPLVLKPSSLNGDWRWGWIDHCRVISWIDIPEKTPQTSRQQIRVSYNDRVYNYEDKLPEDVWEWGDFFMGMKVSSSCRYKLVFYNYDENSFNYLKAMDNKDSNALASLGLAPASFTFTNVKNGVGVCGSYTISETDWFTIEE